MEWYDDEQESTETDEKITGCFLNNIFRSTSQHSANLFLLEHEIQSGKESHTNDIVRWISSIKKTFKFLQGSGRDKKESNVALPKNEKADIDDKQFAAEDSMDKFDLARPRAHNSSLNTVLGSQSNECFKLQPSLPFKRTDLFNEIQSILVVDCHEIFLNLFSRGLKVMMPHVQITTAKSAEEAFLFIRKARSSQLFRKYPLVHGFDVIIVEENLDAGKSRKSATNISSYDSCVSAPSSANIDIELSSCTGKNTKNPVINILKGSDIFQELVREEKEILKSLKYSHMLSTLLIGVSLSLKADEKTIRASGADMVWKKPPPPMNAILTCEILNHLLKKRDCLMQSRKSKKIGRYE
mmetsp:Transcript_15453/g.34693  ORF Transcript_15453/g.34693 Transcript_15453/m.34693 type:complete len:354 (+) Transcript_15453:1125-2186(+)